MSGQENRVCGTLFLDVFVIIPSVSLGVTPMVDKITIKRWNRAATFKRMGGFWRRTTVRLYNNRGKTIGVV
jgi:hypothetical protein